MQLPNHDTIRTLLEEKNGPGLRIALGKLTSPQVVELMEECDNTEGTVLFRLLQRDMMMEVFSLLEPERQDAMLKVLSESETRQLLRQLSPDDRTLLFEELPAEATRRLFELLSPEDLQKTRKLLGYPEESVGRLMTPNYISIRPDWTVREALREVRRRGIDSETVNMLFITDEQGVLLDDVRLRHIILAEPDTRVRQVMDSKFEALSAFADREEAVKLLKKYDVVALPVVDSSGVLIGIVTHDDLFDVAEEEVTEDIHKTSAMEPLKMSYRRAGVLALVRRRFFWLAALVLANLVSGGVIAGFSEELEKYVVLAFFMPLLLGSGGNSGAQSATMMVRALVTGDLHLSHWGSAFIKELAVGLLLGVGLALLASLVGFYQGGEKIALVVGLSMMAIIVFANLTGMLLPFLLTRLKFDPTVASSPLITTICDATGLIIYFSIAKALL
jgi:magnesium transporter